MARAKWLDDAQVWWRRSNGRCTVSIVQFRRPSGATASAVVRECSGDGWESLKLPNGRAPETVDEFIAVAEKAMPMRDVHPVTLRIEPRRRGDGLLTTEVDHYIGDRHVDTRTLSGRRRKRS